LPHKSARGFYYPIIIYIYMLVFIDDSGDPGFKFDKGSTRYFVVLLLSLNNEQEAERVIAAVQSLKKSLGIPDDMEFKFHKSSRKVRLKFLQMIGHHEFKIQALIIDKDKLKDRIIYGDMVKMTLYYARNSIHNAKIWIDGSGDGRFKKKYLATLRQKLNTGQHKVIKSSKIVDSKNNLLIQTADMLAGAIRRSYEGTKSDHAVYKKIIEKHIEAEWHLSDKK
jgi:hypothetical protein